MIAIDTETSLILPGVLAPPLVCVSWFGEGDEGNVHHREDPQAREIFLRALDEGMVTVNGAFDLGVFANTWPDTLPLIFEALDSGRIRDCMIDEQLLDLAEGIFRFEEDEEGNVRPRGYSLAAMAKRYLNIQLEKDTWRLRYHDLYDVADVSSWEPEAFKYSYLDAAMTYKVWEAQKARPNYDRWITEGDAARQTRAAFALHLISSWGIRTDAEGLIALQRTAEETIVRTREILEPRGLVRADGTRSVKHAVRRMLEIRGADVEITASGMGQIADKGWSTAEFLQAAYVAGKWASVSADACRESGDEVLCAYADYSQARSLLSGTIKDLKRGLKVPVQSRYHPLMATGRTSSAGPNIQNLRRLPGVRECFVPRPGNVFISCDYSAAELHTLAQTCYDLFGFSCLGDILNEGRDVHLWFGATLGHLEYAEAERAYKEGDEKVAGLRQLAKAAMFGYPGGCSANTFSAYAKGYGLTLDEHEAAKVKQIWLDTLREMPKFFAYVRDCKSHFAPDLYYCYQPRSQRMREACTYTAACNTSFQGLASDGAKAALYQVVREQYVDSDSPLFGTRTVAFIHDELIVEAPAERCHAVAKRLQEIMEEKFNEYVPDCPTQAEPAAMLRWSKKAKPVFNEHGELIPWEDKRK